MPYLEKLLTVPHELGLRADVRNHVLARLHRCLHVVFATELLTAGPTCTFRGPMIRYCKAWAESSGFTRLNMLMKCIMQCAAGKERIPPQRLLRDATPCFFEINRIVELLATKGTDIIEESHVPPFSIIQAICDGKQITLERYGKPLQLTIETMSSSPSLLMQRYLALLLSLPQGHILPGPVLLSLREGDFGTIVANVRMGEAIQSLALHKIDLCWYVSASLTHTLEFLTPEAQTPRQLLLTPGLKPCNRELTPLAILHLRPELASEQFMAMVPKTGSSILVQESLWALHQILPGLEISRCRSLALRGDFIIEADGAVLAYRDGNVLNYKGQKRPKPWSARVSMGVPDTTFRFWRLGPHHPAEKRGFTQPCFNDEID
jgi:hypothetical protein